MNIAPMERARAARSTCALTLAFASCASTEPHDAVIPPALSPFVDAAEFLPRGHESYLLQRALSRYEVYEGPTPSIEPFEWSDWESDVQPLFAMAGSAFFIEEAKTYPPDFEHFTGKCTGVVVVDFSSDAMRKLRSSQPRPEALDVRTDEQGRMWLQPYFGWSLGTWKVSCVVDDRFLIGASSPEEMEKALSRENSAQQLLTEFPPLLSVSPDAHYVVARHATKVPRGSGLFFEPDQDLVVSVQRSGGPYITWHRQPLRRDSTGVFQWLSQGATSEPAREQGWTRTMLPHGWRTQNACEQVRDQTGETLMLRLLLFGLTIRI